MQSFRNGRSVQKFAQNARSNVLKRNLSLLSLGLILEKGNTMDNLWYLSLHVLFQLLTQNILKKIQKKINVHSLNA